MKNMNKNLFAALAAFSLIGGFSAPASAASRSKKSKVPADSVSPASALTFESGSEELGSKAEDSVDSGSAKDLNFAATAAEETFKSKTVENSVGRVKFLAKGAVGSFQLYALGENGSQIPLLAGYDEFTSSFISLLAGKKEYKLTNNIGIVIGARKTESGIQMVYVVPDVARVLLSFESVPRQVLAKKKISSDVVKVSLSVMNRSNKTMKFSLKEIFDTVLGEQLGPHFSTSEEIAINSERQYRRFDKVKWISSSNSKAGIQFIFSGEGIKTPEAVSLSNKDLLALQKWIPQVISSRTFDSVLSYNNSAVCINWEGKMLEPEEQFELSYYIAVASDGVPLDGNRYVEEFEKSSAAFASSDETEVEDDSYARASELYAAQKYNEAYRVVKEAWKNPENQTYQLSNLKKMIEDKLGFSDFKPSFDSAEKTVPAKKEQKSSKTQKSETAKTEETKNLSYDSEYIQNLIDKIKNLQENSDNVDRNELLKLNYELDEAIKRLEQ